MVISIVSEDTAKICLDLVAMLRKNKVIQLWLMATSIGSENTAKICLDFVALLRQIKVSQLWLIAISIVSEDTAKSCLEPCHTAQTEQGESIEAYGDLHGCGQ